MEPETKKMKTEHEEVEIIPTPILGEQRCQYFVTRKKRFCKMTVANGKQYCGEHEPQIEGTQTGEKDLLSSGRIPCPLDNKHTVNIKNLEKHIRICNSKPIFDLPPYIVKGINNPNDEEYTPIECPKLSEIPPSELKVVAAKVKDLYLKCVEGEMFEMNSQHNVLAEELEVEEYGFATRKHLIQAAALLGCLEECGLLKDSTSYIEFGAGKGQLSFWLAQALVGTQQSKVILIDKMSHRHKQDNKIEDRNIVQRIRADIADFKMSELDLIKDSKSVVGVSKHLCGAATDLAIRCVLQDSTQKTEALLIALCCHHRCNWKSFVGKGFFRANGLTQRDFILMTKMASWAICGTGLSRERNRLLEEEAFYKDVTIDEVAMNDREEIGIQCKRVIDYSRVEYMRRNGFIASLRWYVVRDVTLENTCLLALRPKKE